jgi:hypothetical protein
VLGAGWANFRGVLPYTPQVLDSSFHRDWTRPKAEFVTCFCDITLPCFPDPSLLRSLLKIWPGQTVNALFAFVCLLDLARGRARFPVYFAVCREELRERVAEARPGDLAIVLRHPIRATPRRKCEPSSTTSCCALSSDRSSSPRVMASNRASKGSAISATLPG